MEEKANVYVHQKNDSITLKKSDLYKYSTFVLGALVIVMAFVAFGDNGGVTGNVVNTGGNNAPSPTPSAGPPPSPSQVTASADDDARIGSANAPVEIIEFSDFQCPFCSRAAPTMKQIVSEYGDKVTIVYRDFPLDSIHPMATPAAIAAECVREQSDDETYFEYHDKIFANQQALSNDNLKAWAKELGYDIGSCLDSQKYLSEVRKDLADAQAAGGQGTPYFVINGKPLSGAQPFSAFKQVIDAELA
jgi:protein-disulfide isomerase